MGRITLSRPGADARRDAALVRLGYRVLRLEVQLVLRQLAVAAQLVKGALG